MLKRLLTALLLLMALTLAAQAQPTLEDRLSQIEAQLQLLLDRQGELNEKIAAQETASLEDPLKDQYHPDIIRQLGVLTPDEESRFNQVHAQIVELYSQLEAIELEWVNNQEQPDAEARMLQKVDSLHQQADVLWASILPQAMRLDEARQRLHLKEIGLQDDEVDAYQAIGAQVHQLRLQADQLYEGWAQADAEGRAAIDRQAAMLHQQADDLLSSIPALRSRVSDLENQHYYNHLTALSEEERAELRALDEHIMALYAEMLKLLEPQN